MSDNFTVDDWMEKGINESDFKKSIEFYDNVLFLDPDNQAALYNKGVAFLQLKQYQAAYKTLKALTKLNKKHSEAWYSMGLASEMCDDKVPAKKFYKKALSLDNHNVDAIYGLIRLDINNEQRPYCLKKMTEAMPEEIDNWIELIEFKIRDNELSSAQKYLSNATIHHPNNRKLIEFKEILEKKLLERANENRIKKSNRKKVQKKKVETHISERSVVTQKINTFIPKNYHDDWDPPVTVYCKVYGIPYNSYKYYRTRSSSEIQIRTIEDKLNSHEFNCSCCSSYLDGQCSYKKKYVYKDAICKHFEPQKEPKIKTDSRKNVEKKTLTKINGKIKCPYCNKKLKSEKGLKDHLKIKHPNKIRNK
jgi:tetratricopeptide (TPR) repeat protein